MIVAEYTVDHPILRYTIQYNPDIEITWEDSYPGSRGKEATVVWIASDDFAAVERALHEDPTIGEPTVVTEIQGRRLYRFEVVDEGAKKSFMPLLAEVGGVHQDLSADADGWHNRTRFPDREAFQTVYQFCQDHDMDVTIDHIYYSSGEGETDASGLSAHQHETLIEAVESGYLDIPRQTSLAELGERLGISESAASERFRRGAKTLVRETILPEQSDENSD